MTEQRTGTGRTDAASMIAELWAEREQGRAASSPQGPPPPPPRRPPKAPRPQADPRQRALAVTIALLLVAGVLGVVAKTLGVVGAPSKAEFVAEADAVCTAANGGINAISKPLAYSALATAASTFVTASDTQVDRLRSLDLPGGADRGRARAVFSAMEATTEAGRTLQMAAGSSDPAMTADASRSLSTHSKDALAQAQAFGFTACVTGMQPGTDAVIAGANAMVKDSFLVAGSRLCVDFVRAIEAVPEIRNANDITRFVNEGTALFDKLASDFRALPVPPGDEAAVTEMIAKVDEMSGKLKQLGVAGASGDVRRLNALQREIDVVGDELNAKFGSYGLRTCGEE